MIDEIIQKFEHFSDAIILQIQYKVSVGNPNAKGDVEAIIRCSNSQNEYAYEIIKLIFIDVLKFRFIEHETTSSTVITWALIQIDSDSILFDFFPILYSTTGVENNESDFLVRCLKVKYEKLEQYEEFYFL